MYSPHPGPLLWSGCFKTYKLVILLFKVLSFEDDLGEAKDVTIGLKQLTNTMQHAEAIVRPSASRNPCGLLNKAR